MLTKAHALAEYDFRAGKVLPDRLRRKKDAAYLELADEMIKVYREGIGLRLGELHRRINALFFEIDCPPKRIESFKKLLDDASSSGYIEVPHKKTRTPHHIDNIRGGR